MWRFFDEGVGDYADHGAEDALGEVVEVGEQEDGGEYGDEREEDVGHGCQTARAGVDFATPVTAEGRQRHEESASHVGRAQRDEFAVGAEG